MSTSHYIEATFLETDEADIRLTLGNFWHGLHAVMQRHDLRCAIDFPHWNAPAIDQAGRILAVGSFGSLVRLFADADTLLRIKAEMQGVRTVQGRLVILSDVKTVPEQISGYVACSRVRVHDKTTDGFARRQARRYEKRLAQGKASQRVGDGSIIRERALKTPTNFIALKSVSTGHGYSLRVSRDLAATPVAEAAATIPSSYGLGSAVPTF
jgi:CRISPR-associated endoribonuclease Cas6/Csy4 subtype I-F